MSNTAARRNINPGKVRVKSVEEFSHLDSLDARVEEMVENRNEVAVHNIEYILQQRNIPQAYMCNVDLEGSPQPPQMASYKKKGKDIPFRALTRIAMAYGYTPEQLYGQLLDQDTDTHYVMDDLPARPRDEYMKYVGTYHMAYFGNDAKLGCNKRTTARALAFGVLSVYPGGMVDGVPILRVAAFSNCTQEEQDTLIRSTRNAESQRMGTGVRTCYERVASVRKPGTQEMPRMKCFYEGELILTERIAEINMRQVRGSDIGHISFHNRAANSSEGSMYKGGRATMMSTSRGEEHMPCVQAVILSKRGFANVAKEEVANMLFLEPPQINLQEETKAIISYMKALFPGEDADNPLSQLAESDRAFILESYIEKKLREVIQRNVLGYYKISTGMDSDTYKAMCR